LKKSADGETASTGPWARAECVSARQTKDPSKTVFDSDLSAVKVYLRNLKLPKFEAAFSLKPHLSLLVPHIISMRQTVPRKALHGSAQC
jgi:hypothetical protein